MNQSVLNRIEKGTRPARDIEIAAIATFFHVSADWLLHLTEDEDEFLASLSPDDETPMIPMTAEEETLLRKFRCLDERRRTALSLVAELADKAKS